MPPASRAIGHRATFLGQASEALFWLPAQKRAETDFDHGSNDSGLRPLIRFVPDVRIARHWPCLKRGRSRDHHPLGLSENLDFWDSYLYAFSD